MKKIIKGFFSFAVAFLVIFNFTACKKPISATKTDSSKTIYNGQATNGGMTLVHDGYLYFVNGTKANDGKSAKKNKRSAIYKAKLNDDGTVDENSYQLVVDNLVGFDKGSMYIFGDFLYFATPNDDVNYQDAKLNNQTKFMRYDLVNKKSYEIYTTKSNSSSEVIDYEYYIVNNTLNLVVYEKTSETITSVKVDTEVTTNYIIESVSSCVLSENNGLSLTEGVVDANNFVFYTRNPKTYEYPQEGNYTYKTSPVTNNSFCISNDKKSVSLLSIRNGKLVYSAVAINSSENIVYVDTINNAQTKLSFANIISYKTYENVLFMENEDGSINTVIFDDDTNEITVFKGTYENAQDIKGVVVNTISVSSSSSSSSGSSDEGSKVSFIGITTINEPIESEEEPAEGEESEPETVEVKYLIYIESNKIYKIEIMRDGEISKFNEPVKLTTSTVLTPSGNLVPEVIGENLYLFVKEVVDEKEVDTYYLAVVDLTIEDDSDDYAKLVAVKEEAKK